MIKKLLLLTYCLLSVSIISSQTKLYSQDAIKGKPFQYLGGDEEEDSTANSKKIKIPFPVTKGLLDHEIDPNQYFLGAGDILSVSILSVKPEVYEIPVSPEGKVIIPMAGSVDVKGKSLTEAKEIIKDKISKSFRTNEIDVVLQSIREFKVSISGEVANEVTVNATPVERVSEIISKAGGLLKDASKRHIRIIRLGQDKPINVDLMKFYNLGNLDANPYVVGGDIIIVPPVASNSIITVFGEVKNPGEFEYVEGDSLSTLIKFGQGFLLSAKLDSVEYVTYTNNAEEIASSLIDLSQWKNIFSHNTGLPGDFKLKPGDRVYIRSEIDWQKQHYAYIGGEVKYPGKYAIEENHDRVQDLIKRAGGFTDEAALDFIEFIRQDDIYKIEQELKRYERINPQDLSQSEQRYFQTRLREKKGGMSINFRNVINNPKSEDNVLLVNKDSIYVPRKNNFVNIQGRVNNPGSIRFKEGLTYQDYIELAGGYGFRADQSETIITKPKGDQYLASDMNYKLEPGDVILVPAESDTTFFEYFKTSLTIATQIVTIVGVVLTVVNLSK